MTSGSEIREWDGWPAWENEFRFGDEVLLENERADDSATTMGWAILGSIYAMSSWQELYTLCPSPKADSLSISPECVMRLRF
jgi:hypothetical protein